MPFSERARRFSIHRPTNLDTRVSVACAVSRRIADPYPAVLSRRA